MRSIRNKVASLMSRASILDHWEMRSIRNYGATTLCVKHDFRSLGNALYPELVTRYI